MVLMCKELLGHPPPPVVAMAGYRKPGEPVRFFPQFCFSPPG